LTPKADVGLLSIGEFHAMLQKKSVFFAELCGTPQPITTAYLLWAPKREHVYGVRSAGGLSIK
jgi:hypothetical protein